MLDALENELNFIEQLNPLICAEIGSGSGINITALSKKLTKSRCFAIDINSIACKVTKKVSNFNNGAVVDVVNMDLITCFKPKSIDLLFFNPPYVPTPSEEITDNKIIVKSWAGGIDGREIIDRVFQCLDSILTENGVFYLLIVKENNPQKISSDLKVLGFNSLVIYERRIRGEHLFVLKIFR